MLRFLCDALSLLCAIGEALCNILEALCVVFGVLHDMLICHFAGRCCCVLCMLLRITIAFACHFLSHSRMDCYSYMSTISVLYSSFIQTR